MSWVTVGEVSSVPVADSSLSEEAEFNLVRSRFGNVIASGEGNIEAVRGFVNDAHVLFNKYDAAVEIKYMLYFSLKAMASLCMKDAAVQKSYAYSVGLLSLSFMPEDVEDTSYIFSIAKLAFDMKDYWACIKFCQLNCFAVDAFALSGAGGGINVYVSTAAHLCHRALAAATACQTKLYFPATERSASCCYANSAPLLILCNGLSALDSAGLVAAETTLIRMQNRLNLFLYQLQCVFVTPLSPESDDTESAVVYYYHYIRVKVGHALKDSLPPIPTRQGDAFAFAGAVPQRLSQPPQPPERAVSPGSPLLEPMVMGDVGSPASPWVAEIKAVLSDTNTEDPEIQETTAGEDKSKGEEGTAPVVTRRSSRHQLAAVGEDAQQGTSQVAVDAKDGGGGSLVDTGAVLLSELKGRLKEQFGPLLDSDLVNMRDSDQRRSDADGLLDRVRQELSVLSLDCAGGGSW